VEVTDEDGNRERAHGGEQANDGYP
jgi:hypothetical protein